MSKITEIVDRIRTAAEAGGATPGGADVKKLAQQFESMLMVQMLRDMRESGKWDDSEQPEGLGAETFFETLDVELANYLSKNKGFGLAEELQKAVEKTTGAGKPAGVTAAAPSAAARPASAAAPQAAVASSGVAAEAGGAGLSFAVAPGSITSSFGWRRDPFTGQAKFHRGIDVKASYGQDIQAAGAGKVVASGEQRGYGNTVVVEHANGVQTRYAHLSARVVQVGDTVAAGQVLGRAGHSGRATGTHLHFEVIKDGHHVSPADAGLSTPSVETATD